MELINDGLYYTLDNDTSFSYNDLRRIYNFIKKNEGKIPKTLNLKINLNKYYYVYINEYEIINKKEINLNDESTIDSDSIYINFIDLDKIIKIQLSPNLINSKHGGKIIDLTPLNNQKNEEITNVFDFDINVNNITFNYETEYEESLIIYYKNFINEYEKLETKKIDEKIKINLPLLRSHFNEFDDLAVDETMMIIPLCSKFKKMDSITLEIIKPNNESETNDFFEIKALNLSESEKTKYLNKLNEKNIILPDDLTLCYLSLKEASDNLKIQNILLNENTIECNIYENIENEKIRINRILRGIEKVLQGKSQNPELVEIICSNNILSVENQEQISSYIRDEEYINYLKTEYPKLKNNNEQLTAIDKIMQMEKNDIPIMLIQGPPGTGKTEIIISLARELSKNNKNTLITSNVQVACDNVVDKLKNYKEIILKRYGRIRKPNEYNKQTIKNQINYMTNQVLSSYEYDNEIIDSDEKRNKLILKGNSIKLTKQEITRMYHQEKSRFQPFYTLEESYESTKQDIKNVKEKIEKYQDDIKGLELSYNDIKAQKDNSETELKVQTDNRDSIEKELKKQQKDYQTNENDNIEQDKLKYAQLNSITKRENDIKSYEKTKKELITKKPKLEEEYNKISSINLTDEYNACISSIQNDNTWNTILSKYIKEIEYINKFIELIKMILKNKDFCNRNIMSDNFIKKIYNNRNDLLFFDTDEVEIIKNLEILKKCTDLSMLNQTKVKYFNTNLDGLNKQTLKDAKSQIFKYFKRIQYDYKKIISQLLNLYASERRLNNLILAKKNDCNNIDYNITKLDDNIKQANDDIVKAKDYIKSIESKIENNNFALNELKQKIEDLSEKYRISQQQCEVQQKDYDKKNYDLNELVNDINNQKIELSRLENDLRTLEKNKLDIEESHIKLQYQFGDKYDKYIQYVNYLHKEYNKNDDAQKQIENFMSNIDEKLNIVGHENRQIIYNYAHELSKIKDIEDTESTETKKYLDGMGTHFFDSFRLESKDEYNLISMTTNQVANIIENKELYKELYFDYIILDEASKCSFEDIIISLSHTKHLVLIGDYMQLNPIYEEWQNLSKAQQLIFNNDKNKWEKLNESSFNMLMEQLITYNSENNINNFEQNPYVSSLKKQYRMNEGI